MYYMTMNKRMPWINFKGISKKERFTILEHFRGLGYDIPEADKPAPSRPKPTTLQKKHEGHTWLLERGFWGPHRARYICNDCKGAHIQWVKTK